MGVTNYVVQPQDWDQRGKGVKTDRIDALALCQRLDRYTRGNLKAFSIVRVPTEDEERERAFTRDSGHRSLYILGCVRKFDFYVSSCCRDSCTILLYRNHNDIDRGLRDGGAVRAPKKIT